MQVMRIANIRPDAKTEGGVNLLYVQDLISLSEIFLTCGMLFQIAYVHIVADPE